MNEIFIRSIYKSIVEENGSLYKSLFDNIDADKSSDEYWKKSLQLYNSLSEQNKEIFMTIIQQTIIDTISTMLGIIDGSSTLNGCDAEPTLYLDNVDTENELQDLFLAYVEEIEE